MGVKLDLSRETGNKDWGFSKTRYWDRHL